MAGGVWPCVLLLVVLLADTASAQHVVAKNFFTTPSACAASFVLRADSIFIAADKVLVIDAAGRLLANDDAAGKPLSVLRIIPPFNSPVAVKRLDATRVRLAPRANFRGQVTMRYAAASACCQDPAVALLYRAKCQLLPAFAARNPGLCSRATCEGKLTVTVQAAIGGTITTRKVRFTNSLPAPVYMAFSIGSGTEPKPEGGKTWAIDPGEATTFTYASDAVSLRFWPRTGCVSAFPPDCNSSRLCAPDSPVYRACLVANIPEFICPSYSILGGKVVPFTTKDARQGLPDDRQHCTPDTTCFLFPGQLSFTFPACGSFTGACGFLPDGRTKQLVCVANGAQKDCADPPGPLDYDNWRRLADQVDRCQTLFNGSICAQENAPQVLPKLPRPTDPAFSRALFSCSSGDCGDNDEAAARANGCGGQGLAGKEPYTIFETTANESPAADNFDVSVVDGFNVQMKVEVMKASGTNAGCGIKIDCDPPISGCQPELQLPGVPATFNGAPSPFGPYKAAGCLSLCKALNSPPQNLMYPYLAQLRDAQVTGSSPYPNGINRTNLNLACCQCFDSQTSAGACAATDWCKDLSVPLPSGCNQGVCEFGCSPFSARGKQPPGPDVGTGPNGPGCDYFLWPTDEHGNTYWNNTKAGCKNAYFYQFGEDSDGRPGWTKPGWDCELGADGFFDVTLLPLSAS